MVTQDWLEYVCERVIERLVERVPGTTEENERAWFDQMLKDWIRAQQPADVESAGEEFDEAKSEYRTPVGKPLRKLTIEFARPVTAGAPSGAGAPGLATPQSAPGTRAHWRRAARPGRACSSVGKDACQAHRRPPEILGGTG